MPEYEYRIVRESWRLERKARTTETLEKMTEMINDEVAGGWHVEKLDWGFNWGDSFYFAAFLEREKELDWDDDFGL